MASVGDVIRSKHDEILRCWTEEATRAASARDLDRPELDNIIPHYLDTLADIGPDAVAARRKNLESHTSARLRQGFHVGEVVEELALLGRCIASMWATAPQDQRPDGDQIAALHLELHEAAGLVTTMFQEHLLEDEQTEKRYLRLLEKLASEALRPDAPTFRERLEEALELILAAVGAQSAVLLLFDPAAQKLITVSSAGVGYELVRRYASSLETANFPGKIAATAEQTVAIPDTASTPLELDAGLRRSGIQSMLGIRLPSYRALKGVLYVGLLEKGEFSVRQVRRLEALAESLTLHLEHAQLHAQLQAKVEELTTERALRERFVSVLAHDLRGPLSAVTTATHLLARGATDRQGALVEKISRNIDRAEGMVHDLLDANRIRAGERLPLQLADCDLVEVAREVLADLDSARTGRFVLDAEAPVPGIWSAPELRRAIWNLVTNAVKYGDQDRPITITVRRRNPGGSVSVHNFGAAIPEEEQRTLFLPFKRTEAAQAGSMHGWGLGLTLVWGCALAHGGSVEVESRDREGTTFTVALPPDSRPYQPRPSEVTEAEAANVH